MKKKVIILCFAILLTGCSRPGLNPYVPKPALPFDDKNIVLRAQILSDEHTTRIEKVVEEGTDPVIAKDVYIKALKTFDEITKQKDYDISISAGDHTMEGTLSEDKAFMDAMMEAKPSMPSYFFSCHGNHDVSWGSCATRKEHSDFFNTYGIYDKDEKDSHPELGNNHRIVNGYHFLTIDFATYGTNNNTINKTTFDWANALLEDRFLNEPLKPVFVIGHSPCLNTVFGSDQTCDTGLWGASAELEKLFKNYPNVIYFSGHTHYPLNDERNIWQGDFTAINVPTISGGIDQDSYWKGAKEGSSYEQYKYIGELGGHRAIENSVGLYMEIDKDNNIRITRIDCNQSRKGQIKDQWLIESIKADKSHLNKYNYEKRKNENKAPYVRDDFEFKSYRNNDGSVYLSFDTFLDDDLIYGYELQIFDENNLNPGDFDEPTERMYFIDNFYEQHSLRWQGHAYNYTFKGKNYQPNKYVVRVIGVDSYKAYSIKYPNR